MSVLPNLAGRVALVTGASRGIGAAIAVALAEVGANVAVNFRARVDEADAVVASIEAFGRRAVAVRADVSVGDEVTAMVSEVEHTLGPIDVLVNNAGIGPRRELDSITEADFDQTIAVNLKSVFLCTQAVYSGMRTRGWGRIVNISSGAARGAGGIGAHYNASKAGMEGLTRGYAARLFDDGITVNAVAPTLIATDMIADQELDAANRLRGARVGTVDEVACAVIMVVGNAYMTGQTVLLNGGRAFI